jgi:hypothetical protein
MNSICWRTQTTADAHGRPPARRFRAHVRRCRRAPIPLCASPASSRTAACSIRSPRRQTHLKAELGRTDQVKVTEYLDAVRDVEHRIQTMEAQVDRKLPKLERPAGVPETFTEHAKMMFDLQVLALQTDLTRVTTFMVGREFGGRTYQEIGIPEGYHALTHHQYNAEKIAKVIQIQTYHAKHFAYYLDRLRSTPDGDGSLLDHMVLLYGGGYFRRQYASARQSSGRADGRRLRQA